MATKSSKKVKKQRTSKPEVQGAEKVQTIEKVAANSPVSTMPEAPTTPPKHSSAREVSVTFVLFETEAKVVSLSGEFNGWSKNATPMKQYLDGHWEVAVNLAPGRYQYKFIVDGEWRPDLLARENVLNHHGTLNSIVEIRA